MDAAVRRSASKEQASASPGSCCRNLSSVPGRCRRAGVREDGVRPARLGGRSLRRRIRAAGRAVTSGLPRLDPRAAAARGARSMVIGVANAGGQIPASWFGALLEALEAGLDLVSGMHVRLASLPGLQLAADKYSRRLIDVRTPPPGIPIATGLKRSGRRLLTVGTDCALGKKYTALAITRGLRARQCRRDFRATGQTGIMIAGEGMPLDSVVADFVAGAAEALSPDAPPITSTSSKGRARSFIRPTRGSRWACSTAASPIASSCATSRAARTCSACRIPAAVDRASHRTDDRARPPDQSRHPLRRHQPEHRETRRGRGAARIRQRRKAAVTAGRGSDARRPRIRAPARCL